MCSARVGGDDARFLGSGGGGLAGIRKSCSGMAPVSSAAGFRESFDEALSVEQQD